jgi:hypothetical protein
MEHSDFREAHESWKVKRPPRFEGAEVCGEPPAPTPAPTIAGGTKA